MSNWSGKGLYMALQKVTSQFSRERHYVTDLKIHLVCVTKYCRFVFTKESLELQLFRRFRRWLKEYVRNQQKPS